jgi:hypothetical protein
MISFKKQQILAKKEEKNKLMVRTEYRPCYVGSVSEIDPASDARRIT